MKHKLMLMQTDLEYGRRRDEPEVNEEECLLSRCSLKFVLPTVPYTVGVECKILLNEFNKPTNLRATFLNPNIRIEVKGRDEEKVVMQEGNTKKVGFLSLKRFIIKRGRQKLTDSLKGCSAN